MTESSEPDVNATELPVFSSLHSLEPAQARAAIALAHGGTVTAAADAAGVHRSTIYNWYENDPDFQLAITEIYRERNNRLLDEMRQIESLALDRLRRLLEDDTVPASVHLRAVMQVLNRPKGTLGLEQWHLPSMEAMDTTISRRPSVLETPEFDIHRHSSTVVPEKVMSAAASAAPETPSTGLDISRHSSTLPAKVMTAAASTAPETPSTELDTSRHSATPAATVGRAPSPARDPLAPLPGRRPAAAA